jgi:hypothetical protein
MDEPVEGFGYCDLHEEDMEESEYIYKGCWSCQYFIEGKDFPYVSVFQASKELSVSKSTIRTWLKKGVLRGEVFERERFVNSFPYPVPVRQYHIEKESLKKVKRKMEKNKKIL